MSLSLSVPRPIHDGRPEAWVRGLEPRLSRMAAYYARYSREDADDLLQEAWLGVLEALPGLDPRIGNPEQYLLRYARWRLLDALRRAAQRPPPLPLDEQEDARADAPEEALAETLDLRAFLERLTPIQRAILAGLLAGCTWREAGAHLGCTSANVAYHVRRIGDAYLRWKNDAARLARARDDAI